MISGAPLPFHISIPQRLALHDFEYEQSRITETHRLTNSRTMPLPAPPGRHGLLFIPPQIPKQEEDPGTKRILFSLAETHNVAWTYSGRGTDGSLRLITAADLLHKNPEIVLSEWSDLSFPRSGLDGRQHHDPPPDMPRYCAISHVWQPSEETARRSRDANRPLRVELRNGGVHEVSWLGLVQAATAAHSLGCKYIWLDLMCINQTSHSDKALQIKNMAKIHSNASRVLIMVGGVHAAQSVAQPSTWIHRSWTFQEASLGPCPYVLLNWDIPGTWNGRQARVGFGPLRGGLTLISLSSLLDHGPPIGQKFGMGTLLPSNSKRCLRDYELDQLFNCLGTDQIALNTLRASLYQCQYTLESYSDFGSNTESGSDPSETDSDVSDSENGEVVQHEISSEDSDSGSDSDSPPAKEDGGEGGWDTSRDSDDEDSTSSRSFEPKYEKYCLPGGEGTYQMTKISFRPPRIKLGRICSAGAIWTHMTIATKPTKRQVNLELVSETSISVLVVMTNSIQMTLGRVPLRRARSTTQTHPEV